MLPLTLEGEGGPRSYDVTVHRSGGLLVLEFEPRATGGPFVFQSFYPKVRRALQKLQGASDVTECCAAAVREVQALTGYDRVVAYRFDGRDGPGQVIAEARNEGREPWLGLWFPASDIPPQARRLYARNWIRVIGDVDDRTAGLLPELREETGLGRWTSRRPCCGRSPATTWSTCATSGWPRPCPYRCCTTGSCGG